MNTTRVKEMVFGYNSVDYIGDYINSFVSVFGVSLLDWKKLSEYSDGYHEEEQIAIMDYARNDNIGGCSVCYWLHAYC